MSNLKNKVALITGAGGEHGIGRAIALRFAREGADIAICDLNANARGDWAGLPAVAEEIEAMGRRVLATEVDVTSAEQVEQMVNTARARFGKIDILVNNAGAPRWPRPRTRCRIRRRRLRPRSTRKCQRHLLVFPRRCPPPHQTEQRGQNYQHLINLGTARNRQIRGLLRLKICRHRVHAMPRPGNGTPRHPGQRNLPRPHRNRTPARHSQRTKAYRNIDRRL